MTGTVVGMNDTGSGVVALVLLLRLWRTQSTSKDDTASLNPFRVSVRHPHFSDKLVEVRGESSLQRTGLNIGRLRGDTMQGPPYRLEACVKQACWPRGDKIQRSHSKITWNFRQPSRARTSAVVSTQTSAAKTNTGRDSFSRRTCKHAFTGVRWTTTTNRYCSENRSP